MLEEKQSETGGDDDEIEQQMAQELVDSLNKSVTEDGTEKV